jgi:ribosomal protein L11 methyltransferase
MTRNWSQIEIMWREVDHLGERFSIEILVAWLSLLGIEGSETIGNESQGTTGLRFFLPPSQSADSFLALLRHMLKTQLGELAAQLEMTKATVEEKDWMEEWKKHFDVLPLTQHVWICPSWKSFTAPAGSKVMIMDPGMAFGTGHHASTQLIAQALEDQIFMFHQRKFDPDVLDVGTGTGVLAMCAALLGAARVVAIDNDPEAVEIAKQNVEINHLAGRIEVEGVGIEIMRRKFNIVVANIIAETHVQLLPHYVKRLDEGGVILLSGIIQERQDMVLSKIFELGWVVTHQRQHLEWVCLTAIQDRRRARRS